MSSYASIRFRGIVKKEFRKDFEGIALRGEWDKSKDPVFRAYSEYLQGIPCYSCWAPSNWDECDKKEEPFETLWDPVTGEWQFACTFSERRWPNEGEFIDIMHYFIEKVEVIDSWSESSEEWEDGWSLLEYYEDEVNNQKINVCVLNIVKDRTDMFGGAVYTDKDGNKYVLKPHIEHHPRYLITNVFREDYKYAMVEYAPHGEYGKEGNKIELFRYSYSIHRLEVHNKTGEDLFINEELVKPGEKTIYIGENHL